MNLRTLTIKAERSGKPVGWIRLAGPSATFSDDDAEKMFRNFQTLGPWDERQTFNKLATGWSNGYVTIPPENSALT